MGRTTGTGATILASGENLHDARTEMLRVDQVMISRSEGYASDSTDLTNTGSGDATNAAVNVTFSGVTGCRQTRDGIVNNGCCGMQGCLVD